MKTGEYKTPNIEPSQSFKFKDEELDFNITDFWKWNQSDLVENRNRGVLAEYLVKQALNINSKSRLEWDSYDFETDDNIKIEVKSSAYIQSWEQNKYSRITFNIKPTRKYIENGFSNDEERQSDIYIFCLLHCKDLNVINPMKLEQWTFYLTKTETLGKKLGEQKTVGISTLELIGAVKCEYKNLKTEFIKLRKELT